MHPSATSAPSATPSRTATRAADIGLWLAVAFGAVLTWIGCQSTDLLAQRSADHRLVFGVLWLVAVAVILGRRVSPVAVGVGLVGVLMVAAGQFAAFAAVGALAWSATALGQLVLRWWPARTLTECTVVGLVILGTVVSVLVQYPVNFPWVYALLLGLPLAIAPRSAGELLRTSWRNATEWRPGWVEGLVGGVAVALVGVYTLVVMMPEVGFDALVTHLLLPARIAADHTWGFDVDLNVWAVMPMLGDWLYTIGYMLAGETGARLVNLGCLLLLARLIANVVSWAGGNRLGRTAAVVLYLSTPLTLAESSTLFIESVWSCCVIGGTLAILRIAFSDAGERACDGRHLVVGGLLLGGALAAKAVTFMVLPVLALVLVIRWHRWLRKECAASLGIGGVGFVAVGALPYVRAWLMTGNPVFPFFNHIFESPNYPTEEFAQPTFAEPLAWDTVYRATFESGLYLEARPGAPGFQWLLLLVPVVFAAAVTRRGRLLAVLGVALAILGLTFVKTPYLRYVFPSCALVAGALGVAVGSGFGSAIGRAPLILGAVAAAVLNLTCFTSAGYYAQLDASALTSATGRERYIEQRRPLRAAVDLVNQLNDGGAPVAFFSQPFGTGLRADGLWVSWYNHRFQNAVFACETAEDLGSLLARSGVVYLVEKASWRASHHLLHELPRAVSEEVHGFGDVSVRRLRDGYRFRDELLTTTDFAGTGWQVAADARLLDGVGALVHSAASVIQRVEVDPGQLYRVTASVRRAEPATAANARLQVNWFDASGKRVATSAEVVPCAVEAAHHMVDVRAPMDARSAVVYATGHDKTPVIFESLSFRY